MQIFPPLLLVYAYPSRSRDQQLRDFCRHRFPNFALCYLMNKHRVSFVNLELIFSRRRLILMEKSVDRAMNDADVIYTFIPFVFCCKYRLLKPNSFKTCTDNTLVLSDRYPIIFTFKRSLH